MNELERAPYLKDEDGDIFRREPDGRYTWTWSPYGGVLSEPLGDWTFNEIVIDDQTVAVDGPCG